MAQFQTSKPILQRYCNFLSKTKDTSRSWGVLLWNSRRVILGDDIFGERKSVASGVNVVCPSGTRRRRGRRRRRKRQTKRKRIIGFSIPIRHCWRIKQCLLLRRFFPQRWWWWDSGLKRQCFRAWHDDLWESRVILSDLTGYFLGDIMGYFCGFDWTWGIPPKKGKLHGETHDKPVDFGISYYQTNPFLAKWSTWSRATACIWVIYKDLTATWNHGSGKSSPLVALIQAKFQTRTTGHSIAGSSFSTAKILTPRYAAGVRRKLWSDMVWGFDQYNLWWSFGSAEYLSLTLLSSVVSLWSNSLWKS